MKAREATSSANPLYHASLDTEEYAHLLAARGYEVILHRIEDAEVGGRTVWLARLPA